MPGATEAGSPQVVISLPTDMMQTLVMMLENIIIPHRRRMIIHIGVDRAESGSPPITPGRNISRNSSAKIAQPMAKGRRPTMPAQAALVQGPLGPSAPKLGMVMPLVAQLARETSPMMVNKPALAMMDSAGMEAGKACPNRLSMRP